METRLDLTEINFRYIDMIKISKTFDYLHLYTVLLFDQTSSRITF